MTHICVGNITIIGPDNGLSPGRRQAIIWTNAGILLIGPRGTNFSEISIGIHTFSFKKIHLKMSSAKWRPFCLDLNVLNGVGTYHKAHLKFKQQLHFWIKLKFNQYLGIVGLDHLLIIYKMHMSYSYINAHISHVPVAIGICLWTRSTPTAPISTTPSLRSVKQSNRL